MTLPDAEEYRSLRDTIGRQGTARVCIFVVGVVAWAALAVATAALASLPVATLLPLLVLDGVFEAVVALHAGVQRMAGYIQLTYETDGRGWEHAAAASRPAADPLFAAVFMLAAVVNFVPVLLAEPVAIELIVVGVVHLAFLARVILARRKVGSQMPEVGR